MAHKRSTYRYTLLLSQKAPKALHELVLGAVLNLDQPGVVQMAVGINKRGTDAANLAQELNLPSGVEGNTAGADVVDGDAVLHHVVADRSRVHGGRERAGSWRCWSMWSLMVLFGIVSPVAPYTGP